MRKVLYPDELYRPPSVNQETVYHYASGPQPTTPAPQPTKFPVSPVTVIAAIGICGTILLIRKRG